MFRFEVALAINADNKMWHNLQLVAAIYFMYLLQCTRKCFLEIFLKICVIFFSQAKALMHSKQSHCETCKSEYASELQKTNKHQSEHYQQLVPKTFQVTEIGGITCHGKLIFWQIVLW